MPVFDCFFERVRAGGHAGFEVEQVVGVLVDLVSWCCGESDEVGVEVFEDAPVFLVDAAVRLVDDDEIEVPDPKPAGAVSFELVDQPIIVWYVDTYTRRRCLFR